MTPKLYFVTTISRGKKSKTAELIKRLDDKGYNLLFSFYDTPAYVLAHGVRSHYNLKSGIFMDSGAFSAFTQNVEVNIDSYIKFLQKFGNEFDVYAVLDALGDADKTLLNQAEMEKQELKPLPVFHFGEDWKLLDYYCSKYDYVGLGGMIGGVGIKDNIRSWLDVIFSKYPTHKFHGFGVNTPDVLTTYPFYSLDSSGWYKAGANGDIITSFGQFSIGSKVRKKDDLKPLIWEKIRLLCNERNVTVETLINDSTERAIFNIQTIVEMSKTTPSFNSKQKTLFDFGKQDTSLTIRKKVVKEKVVKQKEGDLTKFLDEKYCSECKQPLIGLTYKHKDRKVCKNCWNKLKSKG